MDRRRFLLTSLAGALAVSLGAEAQQPGRIYRIGFLSGISPVAARSPESFQQGLRELGWLEGQNFIIEYRYAEGRFDRLPDLMAELVRLKVDVIVAGATPVAVAAKNGTGTIPIVMFGVGDPVGLGLVESLARPGGNVTGLAFSVGLDTFGKGLALLKEALPKVRRVAVLSNPANPAHAGAIDNVRTAAGSLGVQSQLLEARGPDHFEGAFAAMARERAEAVLIVSDGMFVLHRARLADLARKNRLPSMYGVRENVEAGGLMSYGPSTAVALRRAAVFVDKILRGAKPADLPVEQPTEFELVVNLKTAKALGVAIPRSLLARADHVIE
jgi:putative ABC transport system substrate-binding protein